MIPPEAFMLCSFSYWFEDPILWTIPTYLIVAMDVLDLWSLKGVPQKIQNMIFEAFQNPKIQIL